MLFKNAPTATYKAQKREFRYYLGGLLGESERKNLFQIAENAIGVNYHQLHYLLLTKPVWALFGLNFCLSPANIQHFIKRLWL